MEQKIKYQYSYFIYPYIVDEKNYGKYMLKLLKDENCKLKIWEKERDLNLYTYFLPEARDYLFWSFSYNEEKKKKLEELDATWKAKLLEKYACTTFEYTLPEDVQGKIGEENGIFFTIPKMDIICFNTGVCFLLLKTIVEEESNFSDILNFNYKFRDINSEFVSLKNYENIRLQSSNFKDIKELSDLIKHITGPDKDAKEMNMTDERFLTYSYVCLDQTSWKEEEDFKNIQDEFVKFSNILPNSHQVNYSDEWYNKQVLSPLKFTKIGFTKQGTAMLTSSTNTENYTKLPFAYEQEYLYTYILVLYRKIYMNMINTEFKTSKNLEQTRAKFLEFTRNIWIQEITADDEGSVLYEKWKQALETEYLYAEIKSKFDMEYKDLNIEKTRRIDRIIIAVLVGTFAFNIINFIMMYLKK